MNLELVEESAEQQERDRAFGMLLRIVKKLSGMDAFNEELLQYSSLIEQASRATSAVHNQEDIAEMPDLELHPWQNCKDAAVAIRPLPRWMKH